MFYDKTIEIIGIGQGQIDDLGIFKPGEETTIKSIDCDVQPYSKELAYREYGYNENVIFRFFSDLDDDIKIGTIVKYNGARYKIVKIIPWDDFLIGLIDNE